MKWIELTKVNLPPMYKQVLLYRKDTNYSKAKYLLSMRIEHDRIMNHWEWHPKITTKHVTHYCLIEEPESTESI